MKHTGKVELNKCYDKKYIMTREYFRHETDVPDTRHEFQIMSERFFKPRISLVWHIY